MTAYAHPSVQLYPYEPAIPSNAVFANVEFGVLQANGHCTNIGICRINTTHTPEIEAGRPKKRRCPQAEALLYTSPKGRLQLFFPRSGMLPCTERVFFRVPVFPVPVAHYLPEPVRNQLPGLQHTVLETGLYPIRRTEAGYFIEF